MSENLQFSILSKPSWDIIAGVRSKAMKFFESHNLNEELLVDTLMCVTELTENALKYGYFATDSHGIFFELSVDKGEIAITVANNVQHESSISNFINTITKIQQSDDVAKLYTDRLMEIMINPDPGVSELGLCRIAYEGGFSIHYMFDQQENKISVTAMKRTR